MLQEGKKSGAGMGFMAVLFALIFIALPIVFRTYLSGTSQIILISFGVGLLVIGGTIVVITRLYVKTSANWAFVKTGMGGRKVILNGGAIVVPVVHEMIPVCLETQRLDVQRFGKDALITGDNLRADVEAEFYIKVEGEEESIISAATSLGSRSGDPAKVQELVLDKLISALRTVAATKTLGELHTKRDEFAQAVQTTLLKDLEHNGLKLETVTISRLDQTPPGDMKGESNIFDAQGLRTIAEITQEQRVKRNAIEREADKKVQAQDVEKDQFIFAQDVIRAEADAEKKRQIEMAQSKAAQEAESFQAEQERLAEVARVKKDEGILVAQQVREQAVQTAEVTKNQAVEIAEREKKIKVAEAEKKQADAEAARLTAEKARETEAQAVITVQVVAKAEREKQQAIIEQQAKAEQERLQKQIEADVSAYAITRKAEAEKTAAQNSAEAVTVKATADKNAAVLKAEGDTAVGMVPINVKAKEVEVDARRVVEVITPELEAKAANEQISVELEVKKLTIQANQAVGEALAKAMGEALGNANMTIWGDPAAVRQLTQSFLDGQSMGKYLSGLVESTPGVVTETAVEAVGAVTAGLKGIGDMGAAWLKSKLGIDVSPDDLQKAVEKVVAKHQSKPAKPTEEQA